MKDMRIVTGTRYTQADRLDRDQAADFARVLIRRLTVNAEYLVRTASGLDYGRDPSLDVAKDAASRIGGYVLPLDSDLCISSYTPVADYRQGN